MKKEQFYELLKPLIEVYDSIEIDMILDLLERIDNYDGVKGTLKWYLDKLSELKLFEKNNVSIVDKNQKEIKKILESIVNKTVENSIKTDNLDTYNKFNNKNITTNEIFDSISATNVIKEALKNTENICNLINTKAIEAAAQEYRNILNKAYLETSTGIYTYTQSIKQAINKMAENGILMVNYDSGKRISIEAAVRRDVITRVNQLVGEVELEKAKELDTNLVYVSQHLGARTRTKYTKEDYEAHDEWQGKVYMIEGSSDKYPNLYEKTGFKKMLGLAGINCYHYFKAYFEWEKIDDQIDIEESRKEREKLDKMREYERNIRKLKRQKAVFEKNDDSENLIKTNSNLKILNKKYNSFLKNNGLYRDYNREYVAVNNVDLFNDNIVDRDFKNIDKSVEHLKIYDLNEGNLIYEMSNNDKGHVGNLKAARLFKKSKPNSLVAVHNHPSNSSFSKKDMLTFNNYDSINLIVVKTDDYLYYLEKNGISKIKKKLIEEEYSKIYAIYCDIYGKNIETRHLANKEFAKKVGWKYGRK